MTTSSGTVSPLRIALVGFGKIAGDQHLAAVSGNDLLALAATVDPAAAGTGRAPHFASLGDLLDSGCEFDAATICTPPQVRCAIALELLAAGKHVLLEKPPAATPAEVSMLHRKADAAGLTLFAAWHSRYAAGVVPAREWLAGKRIGRAAIVWREDVHIWHPGQRWIWQPGGFGVFDPGINALSIATEILPRPLHVTASALQYPANCEAPVAAQLNLAGPDSLEVAVDLDFRQKGPQTWSITVDTDGGQLQLSHGGRVLRTPEAVLEGEDNEYPSLYRHFAALVREGRSHADVDPLRLVSDALRTGSIARVSELVV